LGQDAERASFSDAISTAAGCGSTEKALTIEVIERGPDYSAKIYEVQCGMCRSKLRFTGADARDEWDRNEAFKAIVCPVCSHGVWVKK
jgi:uncharacterized protein CbrC (UPF0167 family)